ncbi:MULTISPECIES: glutathione S-transferase family protein [Pseudoalteromonas]|uniref:Glutathione S-transferase n=1 Tax=Pseudoalteromonas amylolytica TaxID=1859457 RepID=A0A1S1N2D0_9GAMM|nr:MULTISPECIES: glutathione S-transferase family protein [Pseudoalteromonas]OHU90615.1 hypothetical protein BFC16_03145 [Pseudoalteromonas sp. JW3]OHU92764.1 hypothetical protein BET10_04750 [Pseudoalteromonas amylolytica]
MIKLYGNPYSRANRVRWALEEMNVPYQEELTKLGSEGTGSEQFRAINPNARIPVIDDAGLVLFESVPICLYLAKKYGADTLYVDDVHDEAVLLQWSVWAMTELESHIEVASLHLTWFDESIRDPKIADKEQGEVMRCLNMLEKAIEKTGFLVGNHFTIADLIVSEVLTNVVHAKVDLKPFAKLNNYLVNNLSKPSAKAAFAPDVIEPVLG